MNTLLDLADDAADIEGLLTPEEFLTVYQRELPHVVAVDTESPTYKWHLEEAVPFALTFSWGRDRTFYVECSRGGETDEAAAYALYAVLAATPVVVAHHWKYDAHVAKRLLDEHNLPLVVRRVDDTMILDAVLDERRFHGLKELCTDLGIRFGDDSADALKAEIAEWRLRIAEHSGREPGFDEVPKRLMVPYARGDAYLTFELFRHLSTELETQLENGEVRAPGGRDLRDIYELELRFLWVAFQAEERGIRIDTDFVFSQMANLTDEVEMLRRRLNEALPFPMNPGSTDDVAKALIHFGHGDALWTNPKTGKVNLPEWRLELLAMDPAAGDLVKSVLEYRTASKMLNSYYETLAHEHKMDEIGQAIVRCNIKTIGARTGRTSITEPALQTIPRNKGEVRGAFIAREGHKLIFADWQGQELRLLGHYLQRIGDESIVQVYRGSDPDLHRETGAAIFDKEENDVSKEERRLGKEVNFSIVYGAGAEKVGYVVGEVEKEQAITRGKEVLNRVYRRFPGLPKLKKMCEVKMRERGYVVTVFGRRHRERDGKYAYKAVNSLVQGSGADLAKEAAVRVDDAFREARMQAMILLLIHDELLVEAPEDEVELAQQMVRQHMIDFTEIVDCPLEVDVAVTDRWSTK